MLNLKASKQTRSEASKKQGNDQNQIKSIKTLSKSK